MIQGNPTGNRRLKRGIAVCAAVLALYVSFGVWGVPAIVKSQIQSIGSELLGRVVMLERVTFNPFTFEARLFELAIAGEDDGEAMLEIEELSANAQLMSVFGTIRLKSVKVSDGTFRVAVQEGGRLDLQGVLDQFANGEVEETEEEPGTVPAVTVESVEVERFAVAFSDTSLATPFAERIEIERFSGSDLGTVSVRGESERAERSGFEWDFSAVVSSDSGARLEFDGGAFSLAPWTFQLTGDLTGFSIGSVQPYVDTIVLATVDGTLGGHWEIDATLPEGEEPLARIRGRVSVADFLVEDADRRYVGLDQFSVEGIDARYPDMTVELASVAIESPSIVAELDENRLLKQPELLGAEGANLDDSDEGVSALPEVNLVVKQVKVSQGKLALKDEALEEDFSTQIEGLEVSLDGIQVKAGKDGLEAETAVAVQFSILNGTVGISSERMSLGEGGVVDATIEGIDLSELQPYVSEYSHADLEAGTFGATAHLTVYPDFDYEVEGGVELKSLKTRHLRESGRELSQVTRFAVEGAKLKGDVVTVKKVVVEGPHLTVLHDDVGINLERIVRVTEQHIETAVEGAEAASLDVTIDAVEVSDGGLSFMDTALVSTHRTAISKMQFSGTNLSTVPGEVATFRFGMKVDEGGKIEGEGRTRLDAPELESDIRLVVSGYDLTAVSPYWETFLARKLAKGKFEIVSNYKVRDEKLEGTNSFRIDQLTLGEGVESEQAIKWLPVGFAIKLMKDPSGVISYEGLKVGGDLSDPSVSVWGLVGKAIGNMIVKAATSPFSFLASMVGGREDLDTIEFATGQATLGEAGFEKVEAVRKMLSLRPGLRLEVSAATNEAAERSFLRKQLLKHQLAYPERQVTSVMDLLQEIDEANYAEAVAVSYQMLQMEEGKDLVETVEQEEMVTTPEVASSEKSEEGISDAERVGLVKRLRQLFGFGGKKAVVTASTDSASLQSSESEETAEAESNEGTAETALSTGEMFAELVARFPEESVRDEWIRELGALRVQHFKALLFETDGVDASRVFVTEGKLGEGKASNGLNLSLSE